MTNNRRRPTYADYSADSYDYAEKEAARRLALRRANRLRRELGMPPLEPPPRPVAKLIPVVRDKDGLRIHPKGLRALAEALASSKTDTTTKETQDDD